MPDANKSDKQIINDEFQKNKKKTCVTSYKAYKP